MVVGGTQASGVATALAKSGVVGSRIPVTTENLPATVSAQINFGALQDGFEVIETGWVDGSGRFDGRETLMVRIPSWARTDRPYLLIVSDLQYNALAPAEMVHPTDAQGRVQRRGTVKWNSTCPTLTGQADELYFLTGDVGGLASGEEVRVTGRLLHDTQCGPGTTLAVESVRAVGR